MAKAQAPAQVGDKLEVIATGATGTIERLIPCCNELEARMDLDGEVEFFTPDEVILLRTELEF